MSYRSIPSGIGLLLGLGLCLAWGDEGDSRPLLLHLRADANKNDADPCIAFNLAWVAVEKGQEVEMLFDSWAAYNVKEKDFWARYPVPIAYKRIVENEVGDSVEWKEGSYMDLLRYLQNKGMRVSANATFLSLSGDAEKLPDFVERLTVSQVLERLREAEGYGAY